MSENKKPEIKKKSNFNLYNFEIVLWILGIIWLFLYEPGFLVSFVLSLSHNIVEWIWNVIFLWIVLYASMRIWLMPLWRRLFRDQSKLGAKLEWYDPGFKQLTPVTKSLVYKRIGIIVLQALLIKVVMDIEYFSTLHKYSLSFSNFPSRDANSVFVVQKIHQIAYLSLLRWFGIFSVWLWLLSMFEGRTRLIATILTKIHEFKDARKFLKPMPPLPYSMSNETLEMCLFSKINDNKEEEWLKMDEKSLRGNILVIAPTGGGKTTALIRPFAQQAIAWQRQNPDKKAAVIVYDPKAELTPEIKELCQKAEREKDLVLLSAKGDITLNPIKIEKPFAGETAWRVSGWIVSAWENAQGQVSSEPYWKNQNILLCRNLLILLYLEKGIKTTIADVSKTLSITAGGCFENTPAGQKILRFGLRVLIALCAAQDFQEKDACLENILDLYRYNPIEANLITDTVRIRTKARIEECQARFMRTRAEFHFATDDNVRKMLAENESDKDTHSRVEHLVEAEFIKRYGDGRSYSFEEEVKTWIIVESEKLRAEFEAIYGDDPDKHSYLQIICDSCRWLLESWSKIAEDNRGSIVSNMLPFLQKFETPILEKVFSPQNQTLSMREVVATGKIVVIDFPGNRIGDDLANGIVTLVKACWQEAVLASPREEWKRPKVQIGEEYQRFMTTGKGAGSRGDGEFLELGRGFGNIFLAVTQSVSALKVACSRDVEFTKLFANMRTLLCLGTSDPETIELMQRIAGKEVKQRMSQTVTENASDTKLDLLTEKYKGESDSLSISYSRNESLEERLQAEDLVEATGYTACAIVFDGRQNHILRRIALRPHYWPDTLDSYELIKRAEFEPQNRAKFKIKISSDPMRELFAR